MAVATWDVAASNSGLVFSNGNTTATTIGGGSYQLAKGLIPRSSGKYYFELTFTYVSAGADGIGVCSPGFSNTQFLGQLNSSCGLYGDGKCYSATGAVAFSGTVPVNGSVVGVHVDATANLVWFTVNGVIQNSGNPATGVGGVSYGPVSAIPAFGPFTIASSSTLNEGAVAFTYTPAAGYAPWDGTGLFAGAPRAPMPIVDGLPWPYQFNGGRQPYAPARLNPSVTAVQVDAPPFQHPGRTVQSVAQIVQSTQPDPFQWGGMGGRQPYAPSRLNPAILFVQIDNPPFGIPPKWLSGVTQAWQPDPWPPLFMGGAQAYSARHLPIVVTNYIPSDPPFTQQGRNPITETAQRGWQPEAWPFTFSGASQPYAPRRLNPTVTDVVVNNPPFRHQGRSPVAPSIIQQWQPDPWPPTFAGAAQPYAPRRLPPGTLFIAVDNPPFTMRALWPGHVASIIWQSLPATWPVVFAGGSQPYAPRRLTPTETAVPENDPPFTHRGRNPVIAQSIVMMQQPDPWTYSYMGGLGPFVSRKLSPGVPGQQIDNPPFQSRGRLPVTAVEQWAWQPEVWPYTFMGGDQPYQRGTLPPSETGIPRTPNPRLMVRNQILRYVAPRGNG